MPTGDERAFESARRFGVRPPVIALLSGLIAYGAERLWAAPMPVAPAIAFIAAIICWTAAGWLGVSALSLFNRRHTTHDPFGKPSTLATAGPYRISRNPMYLGVALILLSFALVRGTFATLAAPLLFIAVINFLFIPHEERLLGDIFGEEYRSYVTRVRRWL